MNEEYKQLYENGPTQVQVIVRDIKTGAYNATSPNLQLEGILSGETETNLVFDSLKPLNLHKFYMVPFSSNKAFLRKDQVVLLYVARE